MSLLNRRNLAHCVLIVVVFACQTTHLSQTFSQDPELVSDTFSLSATDFLEESKSLLSSTSALASGTEERLTAHAWEHFLSNEQFIVAGDWDALQKLIKTFVERRRLLVNDKQNAVQVEELLSTLKSRVAARLAADPQALSRPELEASESLYALGLMGRSLKNTSEENASLMVRWMETRDWEDMELHDIYNLYSWVNVDSIDRRHFSARWTGFLTAPRTGEYTIRQVQQYSGTDSKLRLTVAGQVILDSTGDRDNRDRFVGKSMQLVAGQPVSIQVDMTHDVTRIDYSEGAPMVFLTWELGNGRQELIPASSFSPPADYQDQGRQGLQGEYFADMNFGDLKVTRLDAALDLIWSWPPTAPSYQEAAKITRQACVDILLDSEFLASSAANEEEEVFSHSMWRIAYRMTATERQELVQKLMQDNSVLKAMSSGAMGRLMQAIYMLPGNEHIELFGKWASVNPQPRCQAGAYPGWGKGHYQTLNTDFYWLIGRFLQGPYWDNTETLIEDYLVRSNGECNLSVAYALAFAARAEAMKSGKSCCQDLRSLFHEKHNDLSLSGDVRVTWLIARTFAEEVLFVHSPPGQPALLREQQYLQEAFLVAESSNYQFWALQEKAARLASLGAEKRLDTLLEQHAEQFNEPKQLQFIQNCRSKCNQFLAIYQQKSRDEEKASHQAYLKEIQRRLVNAQSRKNKTGVTRYQSLLDSAAAVSK